jgi:hypothetical protein
VATSELLWGLAASGLCQALSRKDVEATRNWSVEFAESRRAARKALRAC